MPAFQKFDKPTDVVFVTMDRAGLGAPFAGKVELEPGLQELELLHSGGAGLELCSHDGLQKGKPWTLGPKSGKIQGSSGTGSLGKRLLPKGSWEAAFKCGSFIALKMTGNYDCREY